MKITTKIILSFLAVCAVFTCGSIFAILSSSTINKDDTLLYSDNTIGVETSGNIANDITNLRLALRKYEGLVYEKELGSSAEFPAFDISATYKTTTDDLAKYKKGVNSDRENQLFTAIQQALADYKTDIVDPISDAAGQSDAGKIHTILTNTTTYVDKLNAAATDLTNYNITSAKSRSASNDQLANTLAITMISIISAAILFTIVMLFLIVRVIGQPLGLLKICSEKIAAGDMDIQLDLKRKDEFGNLNKSFVKLAEAVKALINDANSLSNAAVEGKLSARADASKHQGDFRKVVEGINQTLDAVINPVNDVLVVMKEMSVGNNAVSVKADCNGDLKELKDAVNLLATTINTAVNETEYALTEIAQGHLNVEKMRDFRGDWKLISSSVNKTIDFLSDTMSNIYVAAEQVATGSSQVSESSQALSQGATEQASSIEELSSSVTEIASQTRQNAENASKANSLSLKAKSEADTGNSQMKLMLKSMTDINESSANISKVIKVIDDIAFQTNILALNAAVEAARAGQYGKGFAVVAEEVRSLAAKSANAAKETEELIEGSIKKAEAGTKIASETDVALAKIVESIDKVTELVADISSASNEQATGISQINLGIEQVSQVIQTNSATAEESAASSEELSSQADLLNEMVGRFTLRAVGHQQSFASVAIENQQVITERIASKKLHDDKKPSHNLSFSKY